MECLVYKPHKVVSKSEAKHPHNVTENIKHPLGMNMLYLFITNITNMLYLLIKINCQYPEL